MAPNTTSPASRRVVAPGRSAKALVATKTSEPTIRYPVPPPPTNIAHCSAASTQIANTASPIAAGESSLPRFGIVSVFINATTWLAERSSRPEEQLARMAITTHSVPALKSFLEGESAFRAGRIAEAIEAYQRAVAADPDFALAYYRIGNAAAWTQQTELSRNAIARAMRLKDRLSER